MYVSILGGKVLLIQKIRNPPTRRLLRPEHLRGELEGLAGPPHLKMPGVPKFYGSLCMKSENRNQAVRLLLYLNDSNPSRSEASRQLLIFHILP